MCLSGKNMWSEVIEELAVLSMLMEVRVYSVTLHPATIHHPQYLRGWDTSSEVNKCDTEPSCFINQLDIRLRTLIERLLLLNFHRELFMSVGTPVIAPIKMRSFWTYHNLKDTYLYKTVV